MHSCCRNMSDQHLVLTQQPAWYFLCIFDICSGVFTHTNIRDNCPMTPYLATVPEACKNAVQICIRWGLQHGTSVIPRAELDEHVVGNLDVLDWELSAEDYEVCTEK